MYLIDSKTKNIDRFLADYYSQMFDDTINVNIAVYDTLVDNHLLEFEKQNSEETHKRSLEISKNYTPSSDSDKSRPNKNEDKDTNAQIS